MKIYAVSDDSHPAKEIDIGATEKLTYFSWLQDRDIALAGISKPGKKGTICTLEPLNMVTDSHSIAPTITGLSKDAEIADVAYSTDTNVIYIQVKSGDISTIYRTDANNVLTQVSNTPSRHWPDRQFKERGRPALRQRQHRAGLPGGQGRETVDLSR